MNLRKISIVFVLVLMASFLFVFCKNESENNGTKEQKSGTPTESSDKETEVNSSSDKLKKEIKEGLKKEDLRKDLLKKDARSIEEAKNIKDSDLGIDFEKDVTAEDLKEYKAVISTKFGDIHLEFYPEAAPNHVKNFLKLGSSGFYNGTTFHRVIPDFMIQGGDPNTKNDNPADDGMGDPGYTINAEFNEISHKRGILSMARSMDPNSAGSQFFIMHKESPHLDGQYTVFGFVTKGLDVVDKIVAVDRDPKDRPIDDVKMTVEVMKKSKP